MTYKVERFGVTGALICLFEHEGRTYSAQVEKILLGGGTACTICPENGFDELYTKGGCSLDEGGTALLH